MDGSWSRVSHDRVSLNGLNDLDSCSSMRTSSGYRLLTLIKEGGMFWEVVICYVIDLVNLGLLFFNIGHIIHLKDLRMLILNHTGLWN